ncbi:MAG: ATP-binding protein [Candidatus Binatia bacterium]
MSRPPSPADETARLAVLHRCETLDDSGDADIDALVRLAAHLCQAPVAAVSLIDDTRQWFLSRHGLEPDASPHGLGFCAHTVRGTAIFEVADARRHPAFAATLPVIGTAPVVFYAGAPLLTGAGQAIGALCVVDHAPRVLTADQRDVLHQLAQQVMRRLDQRAALAALQALGRERVAHLEQLQRYADTVAHSEQRLSMVLQAVEAGVWDWDLQTGQVHFSPRFAELFELASDGPLPIEDLFVTVDDHELEELHAAFADLFAQRVDRLWQEFQIRTVGGEPRWLRVRGQVTAWGPDGAPRRVVGMAVDVTGDRRRDRQLHAAQKLDAIGGLAAGVAHEINTPLQFVSHNLDFLASQCGHLATRLDALPPPADGEDDLRPVHDEVAGAIAESIDGIDRVTRIVRALKEFSHQGPSTRERIDVNQMVENAVTLTRHEWKLVATFDCDLAPGLPAVSAAAYECGQLLVNLIVNAAHAVLAATRPGQKGRIGVRTRSVGGQVELRVWDTGTGIPPEIHDRVFEPFFTTKAVGQGTGQGLATARAIVERHGGTIAFETEVGRGTTFVVRLPAAGGAVQAA